MNLQRHLSFKQGVTKYGKAPHKPILMLALVDMINRGLVRENKFEISPELVGLFKGNWNQLVTSGHTPNFALPYYHLHNEKSKVWKLNTYPDFKRALTASNSIKSLSTLRAYVKYGQLDDELFLYLLDPVNRAVFRSAVIEKYFPHHTKSSQGNSYEYIEEIEHQIVADDPVSYRQRIQHLLNQSKDEIEEESFIRQGAFKRQIPILYNNTCAVTGLKIDTTLNASMIDACHIVPWAESHDDTVTNGISLCPNLHRAFDRGLISVDDDYRVILSDAFMESESPFNLSQFRNQQLILPAENRYCPSRGNLEWHRKRWGFG
ncbi:MAG: HNH endonuclease [Marinoscillum sp.]